MSRGWLLFMLLLAAVVPGCNKKSSPPPAPQVAPLPQKPQQGQASLPATAVPAKAVQTRVSTAKKPTPLPIQKQISTAVRVLSPGSVSLDFTERRDPFKPFAQIPAGQQAASGKISRTKVRDPLPIQNFDAEKYRITGIITGLKENSALVIDPSGKGFVVKAGMQIGNNDGYIKKITDSAVEVEEAFSDEKGRVRKRLIKLTLIRKK